MSRVRSIVAALAGSAAMALFGMAVPSSVFAAPHAAPQTVTGPGGCNGNWYDYNLIVPAFGGGAALTDEEWSSKGTYIDVQVGSFPSQYDGELYADGFSGGRDTLTSWTTMWYDYSSYNVWYNGSGGQYVRAGFASCPCVTVSIQLIGTWSPNTSCYEHTSRDEGSAYGMPSRCAFPPDVGGCHVRGGPQFSRTPRVHVAEFSRPGS